MMTMRSNPPYALALSILLCKIGSLAAFTLPRNHDLASASAVGRVSKFLQLHAAAAPSPSDSSSGVDNPTTAARTLMEVDESSEYEYNEADFADYSSDYSDADFGIDGDGDEFYSDDDDDSSDSILNGYESYSEIGGFDLSPFEKHAREVFLLYAVQVESTIDHDAENLAPGEVCETVELDNAAILKKDLYSMLQNLDIDATPEESEALFKYLDIDDDGRVSLDEFLPWYAEAIDSAQQAALGFQNLVKSRRTVHKFDATEVDDGVLRRALECAIAAPNRRGTEPWRFIKLGKETVGKVNALRTEMRNMNSMGQSSSINDDAKANSNAEVSSSGVAGSFVSWTSVPHWIVVTYARAPPNSGPEGKIQQREDFKSTCCAVQNFLLSMWSEGIGTKWTDGPVQRTEEFAKLCGINLEKEKVAGVIWYGFAKGGLNKAEPKWRSKGVEEVLDILP